MNIYSYSFVSIIALLVITAIVHRVLVVRKRNRMPKHDDIIVVVHKGTSLPMTVEQEADWWMAMPERDKDRHAKMVKSKVANGSLVAIKVANEIIYVKGDSRAANDFEHIFVGNFSDRIKKRKKK